MFRSKKKKKFQEVLSSCSEASLMSPLIVKSMRYYPEQVK